MAEAKKKKPAAGKQKNTGSDKKLDDARRIALRCIQQVLANGESLSMVIPRETAAMDARDKSLVQALVYGVLRWRWRIESLLNPFLKKPLKKKDLDIKIVLMLGVFQLYWMRTPDYAAVDAAVKTVNKIKKQWARGLVNAILRQLIRERENADVDQSDLNGFYSHPEWIISKVKADWPEHWQTILEQANLPAPMTLRFDAQQIDQKSYLFSLADNGFQAASHTIVPSAIVLEKACDVTSLPGFANGLISVQDAAAQLAAPLIDLEPGMKVLDACAAPGGKTAHMLQHSPGINVDAVDISDMRLERVEENLERLKLSATLIAADIAEVKEWWNGEQYDRILLDAPCSASGVIRRHPDIKSLRREDDIEELTALQASILTALWPLLKPGGKLLYATCSIFKDENEQQMLNFLQQNSDAEEIKITADWGHEQKVGRQILTGDSQMDGFYYALFEKA